MALLTFIFSSMNSGKSLSILTKNYALNDKGFRTVLMKPEIDDRTTTISTRLGIEAPCHIIGKEQLPSDYILKSAAQKPDFILVDEAQFLTETQVWDLAGLADNWGIDVYCYGLKLNWQGEFFEGSQVLMKIADRLEQVETFCKIDHSSPALFHIKHGGTGSTVETGYEDLYDTVSRKQWKLWYDAKLKTD
jgi:thymidine kinase